MVAFHSFTTFLRFSCESKNTRKKPVRYVQCNRESPDQLPQQDETELAGEDLKVRTGVEQSPVSLALHWEGDLRLVSSVGTHGGQQGDLTVITARLSAHHHGFKILKKLEKFPLKYKISFPQIPENASYLVVVTDSIDGTAVGGEEHGAQSQEVD